MGNAVFDDDSILIERSESMISNANEATKRQNIMKVALAKKFKEMLLKKAGQEKLKGESDNKQVTST